MLPENIRGKVLAVDPKWNFVVLNFGENAGALKHGELLVDRGGQLIAKVRIESLQADRCIANVEPGFELHNVLEGDTVFPVTY